MKSIKTILLTILTISSFSASAALILDQNIVPDNASGNGVNIGTAAFKWQQGVTTGVEGQLSQIDLFFFGNAAGTLSIFSGLPWQTGSSIFSSNFNDANGWNSFDVTAADLNLNVGDEFTIQIQGDGSPGGLSVCYYDVGCSYPNIMNLGAFGGPGEEYSARPGSFTFRTFVETNSVSAPATFALCVFGLLSISLTRRNNKG